MATGKSANSGTYQLKSKHLECRNQKQSQRKMETTESEVYKIKNQLKKARDKTRT